MIKNDKPLAKLAIKERTKYLKLLTERDGVTDANKIQKFQRIHLKTYSPLNLLKGYINF